MQLPVLDGWCEDNNNTIMKFIYMEALITTNMENIASHKTEIKTKLLE